MIHTERCRPSAARDTVARRSGMGGSNRAIHVQNRQRVARVGPFICHKRSFADEIVVLYAGRVAEQGDTDKVLAPPFHPYTKLLVSSVPETRIGWLEDATQTREAKSGIAGAVKLTAQGCPFFARCPLAIPGTCDKVDPPRRDDGAGHNIECHRDLSELMAQ